VDTGDKREYDTEIFDFFSWIIFPQAYSNPSGPFQIFRQILVDIHDFVFITGVNDTTDKLVTTPINWHRRLVIAVNNDNLSPVATTTTMKQWQLKVNIK
jgi:hypothetical protein